MDGTNRRRLIEILLVEDNPDDSDLTLEALKEGKARNHLSVVEDGVDALSFLRRQGAYGTAPRPDLVLLDLNLPKKSGLEVLAEMKADPALRRIPVVVLTTSDAERDIVASYNHSASCYITKPVDLGRFLAVVRLIDEFWLDVVQLPPW